MKLVIIESPYAGDVERNTIYARRALKDSLLRGEAPICSHLLHTQVLDDLLPAKRHHGIEAGIAWYKVADAAIFYADYGFSSGMEKAMEYVLTLPKMTIHTRHIGKNTELLECL